MTDQRTVTTTLIDTVGDFDLYETTVCSLYVALTGTTTPLGSAWGPAADRTGDWFACRYSTEVIRVESRDAAITHITATGEAVSALGQLGPCLNCSDSRHDDGAGGCTRYTPDNHMAVDTRD